ncbi:hypothetical protein ACOMHN_000004 [Nucella lapillus]
MLNTKRTNDRCHDRILDTFHHPTPLNKQCRNTSPFTNMNMNGTPDDVIFGACVSRAGRDRVVPRMPRKASAKVQHTPPSLTPPPSIPVSANCCSQFRLLLSFTPSPNFRLLRQRLSRFTMPILQKRRLFTPGILLKMRDRFFFPSPSFLSFYPFCFFRNAS